MRNLALIVFCVSMLFGTGCELLNAFTPGSIVKHPDAPMMIQDAKGLFIRVAVYDKEENKLIEYGWIPVMDATLQGWTLSKFDWEAFIDKRKKENADKPD